MWIPGYERRYNHPLNPAITYALGNSLVNFAVPESRAHVNPYPPAAYYSVATLDMIVRPNIQVYAPVGFPQSNVVVDLAQMRAQAAQTAPIASGEGG